MAWTESHTVLIRHRKLVELAASLRIRPSHAMGHLHALWHVALEQQEDGDLSAWSDEFIALASDFPGDAPQYVRLLQKHRWLDDRRIHDWLDYAGRYLDAKYRVSNPKRLTEIRAKHSKQIVVRNQSDHSQTTVGPPEMTVPDQPNQPDPTNRTNPPSARARRLHGIPDGVDEVIAYGATINPKVDEARCRAFWAHYEGQARTGPSGDVFWVTSSESGTVITNWKAKLPAFGHEKHGPDRKAGGQPNAAELILRSKELDRVEKAINDVLNSVDGHRDLSLADKSKLKELRARRTELKALLGMSV